MIDCKDIETQSNFPEESYPGMLYKLPINFLHKRMSRVKNYLETVNQYKKRIIRIQKKETFWLYLSLLNLYHMKKYRFQATDATVSILLRKMKVLIEIFDRV